MRWLPLFASLLLTPLAAGQAGPLPEAGDVGLSDSVRVSLLTMLPGDEVYSLFGHSAIRIRDDAAGLDRTYNYGTFSFDQPFFVLRFLRGSLNYQLDTDPFWAVLDHYRYLQRPIIEQTLALSPTEARALYDVLEVNALPENRDYRYDFFWDNCSTRLIDVIDAALAQTGRPAVTLPPVESPRTFRQLLKPYVVGMPSVDVGLNLALGSDGDRAATAREETFLPIELAAQLDRATVGGRPLVTRRDTLFWVPGAGLPTPAPRWPLWAAWALFGVGLAATVLAWGRPPSRVGRWADVALFGVVGVVGVIVTLLWFATTHDVMGPNWNLIWAWPTHLGLAVAIARGRVGSGWRRYALVAAGVCALTVLLWAVLPQRLPGAVLPLVLLIGLRLVLRSRGESPRPAKSGTL